jgi:uncharacterized protein with GYD domain
MNYLFLNGRGSYSKGRNMPHYVVLVNWTESGVKDVKQAVAEAEQVRSLLPNFGGSLKALYWTAGRYDVVAIVEAPDDKALSAGLLTMASRGGIHTETLRAFDESDMQEILDKVG